MVNILIFSPHPDDAELIIGGFILRHLCQYKILLVNVTDGGAAGNGTVEIRMFEEQQAAETYHVDSINLGYKDGNLQFMQKEVNEKFVSIIRKYRPSIILAPYKLDQHPDHKAVYKICKEAVYFAGTNIWRKQYEAFQCKNLLFYSQSYIHPGNGVIFFDVTNVYQEKIKLLNVYSSQFGEGATKTIVNTNLFDQIYFKDSYCGKVIGVEYAEQLIAENGICCTNIFDIVKV